MIVTDEGERWRLVTQPDHARFAAELLRLWRGAEVAAHRRRDDLLFATREHDNGWREADAAPRWNAAEGRPHDFLSVPQPVRGEVWLRGTGRFAAERPYAALLITLHALSLLERRGEETWDAVIDELEERREALCEESGAAAGEAAAADHRFLRFADTASLAAASGWTQGFSAELPAAPAALTGDATADGAGGGDGRVVHGRFEPQAGVLHLDPLPLAGATTFRLPARYLDKRDYGGDVELAVALASARWQEMTVRVTA